MDRHGARAQIAVVTALLDQLIQFVSAHPILAYATVFSAALVEAVPVVGSFMPGSSIIIGLSVFVAAGELNLGGVLASAIVGAAIGDGTAFLLAYIQQRRILGLWPLNAYPGVVARSEDFFQRRGAIAVLFARFVPPVRAFVPLTAGVLGMAPLRFYAINVPAIGLWACAHVLPGAFAGELWRQHSTKIAQIEHIVLPALAVIAAIWIVAWLVRRRRAVTTG